MRGTRESRSGSLVRSWGALPGRAALMMIVGLLAMSACGGDEADAGSIEGDPKLVDESGTVVESKFGDRLPELPASGEDYGIVDAPDGWDLRVVWSSEACEASPTVKTQGDDGISTILIDPGPRGSGDDGEGPGMCPQAEEIHGFDLKLSKPAADDITVQMKGAG